MLKSYKQFLNESNTSVDHLKDKIDYTQLDPNVPNEELYKLADIATDEGFATICVMPNKVKYLREVLDEFNTDKGSNVGITTVVSFPQGTNTSEQKLNECNQCIRDGADEVDMVMNYKELINLDNSAGDENEEFENIQYEIKQLADTCHNKGKILKVIVESGLLTNNQTEYATILCINAGADFIKTSTGKVDVGAEIDKVQIMYNTINNMNSGMKIKASGGIRTAQEMLEFEPYVDRYGMGYGSVNTIYGVDMTGSDNY